MCLYQRPAKLAVLITLTLLLLCYGVGNVHCATVHENSEDFKSLLEFKRNIIDPNGALSNWNPDTHFCHWNGVNCTLTPPWRVMNLTLSGQGLAGQISSSLGNLTFLEQLDLSDNSLTGPIPLLNRLQNLSILYLGGNLLQGVIPDALTNCSKLAYLNLSNNNIMGAIPSRIDFLTKLAAIVIDRNDLTESIPAALGNITSLQIVSFLNNQLSGKIPHELWHMQNLTFLYLAENNLSGGIPQILPTMPNLNQLSVASNMLVNTLPPNIGDALPSLQCLYLGRNRFEGHIPASLGNALDLEDIDMSNNGFTGPIPSSFGNLSQLSYLNLGGNKLEARDSGGWAFFHALSNCNHLYKLILSNNQLQGAIPNSLGNLSKNLQYLQMEGNHLSGIVPPSIQKIKNLIFLALEHNNLTGTIEVWVGKLTNLQYLKLQSNSFIGTIPSSIKNLKKLTVFSVAQNKFTGFVPPSLGSLNQMSELNLSYNDFHGNVPVEFGNFRQLNILDLSSNKFNGDIPESMGQYEQIGTIRMDKNILTGIVPDSFRNLKTLTMLNLSHNNLSGPMPACLNVLASLIKLDLSYNDFQGEVPTSGIFNNATVVSLDGNPGLCGGVTGFHMPSCHNKVVRKRIGALNYVVKILIPIFGFTSLGFLIYFLLVVKNKSRRTYLSQQSFGDHFEKVTYNDIAQATRGFSESNLIGRGSYGTVYRGKLKESNMEVAVKVFDLEMRGAERSFMAECEALRSIQHRNLLPILTACSTVDNAGTLFKALVYELMPNGSLDTWLHNKGDEKAPKRLGLTQRISIAVNIADALDYLHNDCGRTTVHCDLKPSNILLDDDMTALLGDFGIARFYVDPQSTRAGSVSSIGVKGTIGYIPPEYGEGGHASTSGDVYSFGTLMLEILTSKRPTDPMFVDGRDIISYVKNSFPDQIFHVIDVHLVEECNILTQKKNVPENEIYQCLVDLLQVALSCTHSAPSERSNMKKVASKLHAIKASHFGWKYKSG